MTQGDTHTNRTEERPVLFHLMKSLLRIEPLKGRNVKRKREGEWGGGCRCHAILELQALTTMIPQPDQKEIKRKWQNNGNQVMLEYLCGRTGLHNAHCLFASDVVLF